MPDFDMVVAAGVRAERARLQWSQAELGNRLGWSVSKVSRLERNTCRVRTSDLPALCKALEVTLPQLAQGARPRDLSALGL